MLAIRIRVKTVDHVACKMATPRARVRRATPEPTVKLVRLITLLRNFVVILNFNRLLNKFKKLSTRVLFRVKMAESATLTRWANRHAVVCPTTLDTTVRPVNDK